MTGRIPTKLKSKLIDILYDLPGTSFKKEAVQHYPYHRYTYYDAAQNKLYSIFQWMESQDCWGESLGSIPHYYLRVSVGCTEGGKDGNYVEAEGDDVRRLYETIEARLATIAKERSWEIANELRKRKAKILRDLKKFKD